MAGEQASVCGKVLRSTCAIEVKGHKRRPPHFWEAVRCPKTTFELADNMLFSLSFCEDIARCLPSLSRLAAQHGIRDSSSNRSRDAQMTEIFNFDFF